VQDREASCIDQTKRRLITRIKEHRNDINKKRGNLSVISTHRLQDHDFYWDGVHILNNEPSWYKRMISEMIYIKTQSNGLQWNKQSDRNTLTRTIQSNHITFKIVLSLEPSNSSLIVCSFQLHSFPFLCLSLFPFIFKFRLLFCLFYCLYWLHTILSLILVAIVPSSILM